MPLNKKTTEIYYKLYTTDNILNEDNFDILSIRLNADSFKYATFNDVEQETAETLIWKTDVSLSLTANLRKFFQENEELCNCRQALVKLESARFVTVPLELFSETDAEVFFYHNHTKRENETILYNKLKNPEVMVVYGFDTNAYHLLTAQFSEISFTIHLCSILTKLAERSRQGNNKKMYVNLTPDFIDVVCYDYGKLLLANSYVCREMSDQFYYIMYAWLQVGFNQENDEIAFIGKTTEKAKLIASIDKYIRHRTDIKAIEEKETNNIQ